MARNERQDEIVKLVRSQGFVSVESLVENFGVTPQTIRRDINMLCDEGVLRRYHGGASSVSGAENVDYSTRKILHLSEKQRIAEAVAEHIPDYASLFINLGTTTEEVAKKLCDHKGLRIITNNLNVASMMARIEGFEVIITPGEVRARDLGVTGGFTSDFIRGFKVDYGIIGISGIDEDGTLRDYDYREVRVADAIIENSREVVLAADNSKFGRNALIQQGSMAQINDLFTDLPPPPNMTDIFAESGTTVHVAKSAPTTSREP